MPGLLNPRSGGVVRSALLHARTLAEAGCQVTVLGLQNSNYPASRNEIPLRNCDVVICGADGSGTQSPSLVSAFEAIAPSLDCLHLNGHWRPINYDVARICRRLSLPYIISSRCEAVVSSDLDSDLRIPLRGHELDYVGGAYAVHVTSDFEAQRSSHGARPRHLIQIPNEIDLRDFTAPLDRHDCRRRLQIPDDAFAMLFFGRIVPCKNPGFLIDVLSRHRDRGVRLYFVGCVADEDRDALMAQAAQAGVAESVMFAGYVEGRARADWLTAADLFLLPSFGENFCHSLVEAAAVGVQCIVSPFVGAAEFLPREVVRILPLDADRWTEACEAWRTRGAKRPAHVKVDGPLRSENILRAWQRVYASLPSPLRPTVQS